MGKVTFIFMVVLYFLTGCALYDIAPKKIKKEFNYEPIEDHNNFGRIYQRIDDNMTIYLIFYSDGTFCNPSDLNRYGVKSIQDLTETACKGEKKDFYRFGNWGYYEMHQDTLIVRNMVQRNYGNGYWWAFLTKFTITEESLNEISVRKIHPDESIIKDSHITPEQLKSWVYLDTCSCKESDTWMKYEKWFWKNEQDYLDWIEKSGGDKRKYHY